MIKNEYNNELTTKSNNNTNEIGSPKKNLRKDGKGNLILKKKDSPVKKTKHHAHLIDNLIPGKNLANIVEVESYKKYNLDEEQMEDDKDIQPEEIQEENKVVVSHGCCLIF